MARVGSLRNAARLLARIGCVAIGTVYVLVGVLALLALSGRLIEAADEERTLTKRRPDQISGIEFKVYAAQSYSWRRASPLATCSPM
jgi:hypothetical protein